MLLFGVGQKPNPVARMWSSDRGSWYAMPLRIKPALGQVSEYSAKPSAWSFTRASKQTCDVLHDEESRSYFASKSVDFGPEAASRAFQSCTSPSDRDVLAGEAPTDDIDSNSICREAFSGKTSHVVIDGDVGPMFCEDFLAERLDFTERDGSHSGSFEPEGEAADPAEKVEDIHLLKVGCFAITGVRPPCGKTRSRCSSRWTTRASGCPRYL